MPENPNKQTNKGKIFLINLEWLTFISLVGRVFANDLGDPGSIPGRVKTRTLKMVLATSLLNTQQYKVGIKGKWSNSRKGVAPSPTPRCSSYWKGNLMVTFDYDRQQQHSMDKKSVRGAFQLWKLVKIGSLEREYASSIFSIFPLGMKSNALWKFYKWKCCLEIFCKNSDDSTNCQNLWGCGSISLDIYTER